MSSLETSHSSPSQASYGVPYVFISEKNCCVIKTFDCITNQRSQWHLICHTYLCYMFGSFWFNAAERHVGDHFIWLTVENATESYHEIDSIILRNENLFPIGWSWLLWWASSHAYNASLYTVNYNMTVWSLAGNYISFTIAAGLIRLHMPGVKKYRV